MRTRRRPPPKDHEAVPLPIWGELLFGVELAFLRISPVYWGYSLPRGNGSAVVLVPGFLGTDLYLTEFRAWLRRIGYKPYYSGIRVNAECPNLLIQQHLYASIQQAYQSTRKKIHLIGHSLGGTMARAVAAQMPDRIASVITLGSPIHALAGHASVLGVAEMIRKQILERHGRDVLPGCYTSRCTCAFLEALRGDFPKSVRQTAIYTKADGILDWRTCRTGDPSIDFEVSATHTGLVFSPIVYSVVAQRLAGKGPREIPCKTGSKSE